MGPGWKHIVATREEECLKLYVDGELVAQSSAFRPDDYDLSNDQPLKIGFGELDYFSGRIRDVRLYNRALDDNEIGAVLASASRVP